MSVETRTSVSDYLHGLILGSSEIENFLNALTRLAVHELSTDGEELLCGITLLRHKQAGTVASSSERAQDLDEVQYKFLDGPCLRASRTQSMVHAPELETDDRWPVYREFVLDRGIRSVLAIPFPMRNDDRAALNIYADVAHAFTPEKVELAKGYAQQASQAFALALDLARHKDTADNALEAMKSRTTINLAVGMIMGQNKCSQERAVEILKSASSSRNIKLRDVAAAMVEHTGNEDPNTHFDA
ncbi:MAG: GAF and ANTAR domain-containing protein [Micrococcaceae bacterium]|nr:GAF and ANTAR domain-containing protein [Micrococcaceae bacterium]